MKIEKLRKNHKKKIIIGTILAVVIGGALTYRLTHSKYRTTQSIDLATGVINYTVPDFQIMAVKTSDDGENYIDTNTVPVSGYILNTSKSTCKVLDTVDSNITIEYTDGKINFLGATQKGTKCYLYFDKQILGADKILANIAVKEGTPDFSKNATTNEGVYQTSDEMYEGATYYWRGAVTNNYVKFAGFCWRIIRINGDKTIRLIYDGTSCHANGIKTTESLIQPASGTTTYAYNSNNTRTSYVGWTYSSSQRPNLSLDSSTGLTVGGTDSNAKIQIEKWYNNNIGNNETYNLLVANGKFCNDRDTASGGSTGWSASGTAFNYAGYTRLITNKTPTFECSNLGDIYTLKVGLITADEVAFAGGVWRTKDSSNYNPSYYLYNGNYYWTMSPARWVGSAGVFTSMFTMNSDGNLNSDNVDETWGLRPVINLKADTTFSSGDGSILNPYVAS